MKKFKILLVLLVTVMIICLSLTYCKVFLDTGDTRDTVAAKWDDAIFSFDSNIYTLPFDVTYLTDKGWYADSVMTTQYKSNNYDEHRYNVGVYAYNGEVYTFCCSIDPTSYSELDYPEMMLVDEITWGATVSEIVACYDTPNSLRDIPESSLIELIYESYRSKMVLIVDKKYGLISIDLSLK